MINKLKENNQKKIFNPNIETNKSIIHILKINHKKSIAFYDWLMYEEENIKWYNKNKHQIELNENGIRIFDNTISLENIEENGERYFKEDKAKKYTKIYRRDFPNFEEIIKDLPGNNENKIKFLTKILGLELLGYKYINSKIQGLGNSGYYYSSDNKIMIFYKTSEINDICFVDLNDNDYSFCIRI